MKVPRRRPVFLALALAGAVGVATAAAPPEPCPDSQQTTGLYYNHSFGFTAEIPAGLEGRWIGPRCVEHAEGCTCFPDHGRTISLGQGTRLTIYAGFVLPELRLPQLLLDDIDLFRKGAEFLDFQLRTLNNTELGGFPALSYEATREKGEERFVKYAVVALNDKESIEFIVTLEGRESMVRLHRADFESLVRTWKAAPRQ